MRAGRALNITARSLPSPFSGMSTSAGTVGLVMLVMVTSELLYVSSASTGGTYSSAGHCAGVGLGKTLDVLTCLC